MRKARVAAVTAVKQEFLTAEQAQDDATISAARCVATMLEARRDANLPLNTGIEALAEMSRAVTLSLEARACIIRAHPMLAALPGQIGITGYGDGLPCPPVDAPSGEDRAPLRAVA
ncbi:MAG: hypothetical protein V4472_10835 [Pseudomonadota bacterium]